MSKDRNPANRLLRGTFLLAAGVAAVLIGAPAGAQRVISQDIPPEDPVNEWGLQPGPSNRFFIDDSGDVEVIRFKTARDVELCAGAGSKYGPGNPNGYPIKATWDSDTAIINPGNCLAFDARTVKVSAASKLPQDVIIAGSFRVVK